MLIPYNTDAPLYHPPVATICTIILNVLLFVPIIALDDAYDSRKDFQQRLVNMKEEDIPTTDEDGQPIDPKVRQEFVNKLRELKRNHAGESGGFSIWRLLTLEFGKFRPWQWLTANYMHADIFHLLGNMFVLWGFGLVVEGKVGWWQFLLIYNAIGIVGWGFVQLVMLLSAGGIGLGASLAIFGIVVIALVWAPSNEMNCIFLLGFRPISFDASIMLIATLALFIQVAISVIHIARSPDMSVALSITSEVLHLIGAVLGFAIGVVMVKQNWVDCENWDMFSVWAGKNVQTIQDDRADVAQKIEQLKQQERTKLEQRASPPIPAAMQANQAEILLSQFRSALTTGQPVAAWAAYQRGLKQFPGWRIPEPDFVNYISLLRKLGQWEEAAAAMQEYLKIYTERETTIRIALAQLLDQKLNRPREAWQLLESMNVAFLDPQQKATFDKLRIAIHQRLTTGRQPPRPNP